MTHEVRSPDCLDPETMAAYADGRLDARVCADVERHLADCEDCYAVFSDIVHTLTLPVTSGVADESRKTASVLHAGWRGIMSAVAALLVVGVGLAWWRSPDRQLTRALSALSDAQRTNRLAEGRLSIDTRWSARPAEVRGPAAPASLDVIEATVRIKRLTMAASTASELRARAFAEAASGELDASVDDLRRAVSVQQGSKAEVRSDLAAILLERHRRTARLTDVVDALDASGLALGESPRLPPALFNKALALDILGPRTLAIDAWQAYIAVDPSSPWADEAKQRLAALRARPEDPRSKTTALFHAIDRTLLPHWAARAMAADRVDAAELASALTELSASTNDRETLDIGRAAVAAPTRSGARTCLAQAIAQLDEWNKAYERVDQAGAQKLASDAEANLRCAGLSPVIAQIRWALAGDRNAVFQRLGDLADAATSLGYFRIASLAHIARGNSALRRAELTDGMSQLKIAREIAYASGDLELSATADAMMADGSRELGDAENAWRYLQSALEGLPAAANLRLVYSIVRAAAGAALDDGHSAASLPYSKYLIESTVTWRQPAARIIAQLDRSRALAAAGLQSMAKESIDAADALVPDVADGPTRAEFVAEVNLARGHLALADSPGNAIPFLSAAHDFFQSHRTTVRLASVLLDRGRAYSRLSDVVGARHDWNDAASLIEDQQPSVRDAQLRISRFSSLWDVFDELVRSYGNDPVESLAVVERARARELLDSIDSSQRASLRSGSAMWNWMPQRTAAIVYSVLPDELITWIVDRNGPVVHRLPLTSASLDALVSVGIKELREGREARDLSHVLLNALPVGLQDASLLIVPDGPLDFVPFAALTVPGTSQRLVERWTPSFAPSLSVAQAMAERSVNGSPINRVLLAGFAGDDASALPLLSGVDSEIQALRRIYPYATVLNGSSATPERFLDEASNSSIIHVAAHGVLNLAYPSRSYLQLARGGAGSTLTPSHIARTRLESAPTVVLSACDAGIGRVYRGEGQLSLARPFLAAGAAAVIAAQFPISDAVAPRLAAALHAQLSRGVPAAVALASVQREAIATGSNAGDWASLMVIGGLPADRAPKSKGL